MPRTYYEHLRNSICQDGQDKLKWFKDRNITLEDVWNYYNTGLSGPDIATVITNILVYTNQELPKRKNKKEVVTAYDINEWENPFIGNKLKTEITQEEEMAAKKKTTTEPNKEVKEVIKKYMEKTPLKELIGKDVSVQMTIDDVDEDYVYLSVEGSLSGDQVTVSIEDFYEAI